jgi:putative peptidoglycan lipid II flippase
MVANILLAIAMVGPLGHLGIALAMSISASAEALVLVFLLRPRLPGLLGGDLFFSLTRTGVAAAGLLVALVPAAAALRMAATPPVVQLAGAVALGGAVYVVVAFVLRSPELHSVLRLVRAKVRN